MAKKLVDLSKHPKKASNRNMNYCVLYNVIESVREISGGSHQCFLELGVGEPI